MPKANNKIVFLILLGVVFGLFGGIVGFLLANNYLFNFSLGLPFWGQVSIDQNRYSGANLIIRDAKKVVVEQDTKIKNTIELVQPSLVGIYSRAQTAKADLPLDLKYYYWLGQPEASGLILTSDGWIVTAWRPQKAKELNKWVVVLANKKVYVPDSLIVDKKTGYSFIHIKANSLPVVQFSDNLNLAGALAIIIKDWQTAAVNFFAKISQGGPVYSSDELKLDLMFSAPVSDQWANAFVFDASGSLVGLSAQGKFCHAAVLRPSLDSILRSGKIFWPNLGLKYILLPEITANKALKQSQGALIVSVETKKFNQTFGQSNKIGLRPGDIILSINGLAVNSQQSIAQILGKSIGNKELIFEYQRAGKKQEWRLKLPDFAL